MRPEPACLAIVCRHGNNIAIKTGAKKFFAQKFADDGKYLFWGNAKHGSVEEEAQWGDQSLELFAKFMTPRVNVGPLFFSRSLFHCVKNAIRVRDVIRVV